MGSFAEDGGGSGQQSVCSPQSCFRVLLTDDSMAVRSAIREILRQHADLDTALVIDEAECGEQAINMAAAHSYDVIFLDVEMPGMGGLEACRRLKRFSDARVVMLSSMTSGGDHQAGREAGCDNYLTKPPNASDIKVILRLVSIRKLTQTG